MASLNALPVRTAVRFPLHLNIVLSTPDRDYEAVTEDVSSNGLLFFSEELPPIGTQVEFRVTMPAAIMGGTEDVLLHCVGRIIRHTQVRGRKMAGAVIDEYDLKAGRL